MALNTKQPTDLPSTDKLKSIPDDLLGPVPREIRLGANTILIMDPPPEVGDVITICARLRVFKDGKEKPTTESELTYFSYAKLVTAWIQGQPEPPDEDEEQPGLYDDMPGDDDQDEPEVDVNEGVDRPGFSDVNE